MSKPRRKHTSPDFPDAYRVNRYVRGFGADRSSEEALGDFMARARLARLALLLRRWPALFHLAFPLFS